LRDRYDSGRFSGCMDYASGLLVRRFSLAPCVVSRFRVIGIRFGLVAAKSFT